MKWFRFYSEVVDDPKVQKLPAKQFRLWVNLLCIAAQNDGEIPSLDDLSFRVRAPLPELKQAMDDLTERGLFHVEDNGTYAPHNWNERQYKSDNVTERVRKHREQVKRSRNVSGNNIETPSDTDTDTDTEKQEHTAPEGADFSLSSPSAVSVTQTTAETKVVSSKRGLKVIEVSAFDSWFEREFWPHYPKKVGKAAARQSAKRKMTTRELMDRALAAIQAQAPTVDDPRYFPNGSTWFNQERWNDEVYAPQRPETKHDRTMAAFDAAMAYEAEVKMRLAGQAPEPKRIAQ